MTCNDAFAMIAKVNAIKKDTGPKDRPDDQAAWDAIEHIAGCETCKVRFPKEVCADGGITSWVLKNLENSRSALHICMHRCIDVPCCVTDESKVKVLMKSLHQLHVAYLQAKHASLVAELEPQC